VAAVIVVSIAWCLGMKLQHKVACALEHDLGVTVAGGNVAFPLTKASTTNMTVSWFVCYSIANLIGSGMGGFDKYTRESGNR
jgi:hypothetical protein